MSIYINSRFLTQPITGVQRYAIEISRHLKKINPRINFISPSNIMHDNLASELEVKIVGKMKGHLWEQIELPIFLFKNKFPLLLNLANTAPLIYKNKISTIFDLSFLYNPKWFSYSFFLLYNFMIPRVIKSSIHIFTDSNYIKMEIYKKFNYSLTDITVAYGDASMIFRESTKEKIIDKEKDYILAVGSIDPRKNLKNLIEAFKLINDDVRLIIVGGENKIFKNNNIAKTIKNDRRISFTGYISDDELRILYMNASVFIYPSFYEGFGIPPLEAQACGCPVIVSNVTSLPEVCRNSVIFCNPNNIIDIAEKIELVINNINLQSELSKKGFKNINRFSWRESAELINTILQLHT